MTVTEHDIDLLDIGPDEPPMYDSFTALFEACPALFLESGLGLMGPALAPAGIYQRNLIDSTERASYASEAAARAIYHGLRTRFTRETIEAWEGGRND